MIWDLIDLTATEKERQEAIRKYFEDRKKK